MSDQEQTSKTILVAIDGSQASQSAARTAIQIAKKQGLKVHGLYVVDEVLVLDRYANYRLELGEEVQEPSNGQIIDLFEKQGSQAIEWLEKQCFTSEVPVTTEMLFGGVEELVVEKSKEADLLALGRHGHGHEQDAFHLGRMFRHIAHHSRAPVLVGGERSDSIHRLLLAYDGTNKAKRALAWSSKLQRALQCQVVVISVSQDEYAFQEWIDEMRTDIESSDLTNYRFESREGEPAKEIVATAKEEHADLILAGKYEHSAFVDWIIGSTLDHVLQKTPLPLIAA